MKDYYAILTVHPTASPEVIKKVYFMLAKEYHPDTTTLAKDVAETKMRELNEAYEVISNPARRAEYDRQMAIAQAQSKQLSDYEAVKRAAENAKATKIQNAKNSLKNLCSSYMRLINEKIIHNADNTNKAGICLDYLNSFYRDVKSDYLVLDEENAWDYETKDLYGKTLWWFAASFNSNGDITNAQKAASMATHFIDSTSDSYREFEKFKSQINNAQNITQPNHNVSSNDISATSNTNEFVSENTSPNYMNYIVKAVIVFIVFMVGIGVFVTNGSNSIKLTSYELGKKANELGHTTFIQQYKGKMFEITEPKVLCTTNLAVNNEFAAILETTVIEIVNENLDASKKMNLSKSVVLFGDTSNNCGKFYVIDATKLSDKDKSKVGKVIETAAAGDPDDLYYHKPLRIEGELVTAGKMNGRINLTFANCKIVDDESTIGYKSSTSTNNNLKASFKSKADNSYTGTAVITGDEVLLRREPSTSSEIVKVLNKGDKVNFIDNVYNAGASSGVLTRNVTVQARVDACEDVAAGVNGKTMELKQGLGVRIINDLGSQYECIIKSEAVNITVVLNKSDVYMVTSADWNYVRLPSGETGYVYHKYVQK